MPTSPVITIGRPAIDESGYSSIGQLLLAIPQNFSGGQNPGVIGARGNNEFTISGAYSPNLHGLGADSTLTLVDGHRLAYDGYQNGVDLSVIPLAAVDRVEIMTDGASALYGSDAVAGVVNVILKRHYEGVTADARYGDVTTGEASQAQYSVLGGHDWTSGSALLAYEYSHSDPLYASDRSFSAGAAQPTTLLPELNRNSVFVDLDQELHEGVTASVEALYTARSYAQTITYRGLVNYAESRVRQYGVSPSLTIALPGAWTLTAEGTLSGDRDAQRSPQISLKTGQQTNASPYSYANAMRLGEIRGTGPIIQLPSGPLELAIGAGYRSETFSNVEPAHPTFSVYASRSIAFAYGEIGLPLVAPSATRALLNRLDLSAAYRFERYSDFGGESTPKVGIVYVPSAYLHVRGTWSRSFRAPEFVDLAGLKQLYIAPASAFGSAPGTTALLTNGANPALGPESAVSETAGLDILWPGRPSFKISPTYFRIDYRDRIVQPIDNLSRGLTSPLYAPFVTRNPTPGQLQALFEQATYIANFTGAPYDAASVSAILDNSDQNASEQTIHGVDLAVQDAWPLDGGELNLLAGGTWLSIMQRTISGAPQTEITGTVFNPPRFKARTSATWAHGGWSATATFNYVGRESDNSGRAVIPVGSWSTIDMQLAYAFVEARGVLRGLKASLSVQNILDRDPPHIAASSTVYPGLSYDAANASPLGRFVSAYVSKSW